MVAVTGANIQLLTAMYRKLMPMASTVGASEPEDRLLGQPSWDTRDCVPLQSVFVDSLECVTELATIAANAASIGLRSPSASVWSMGDCLN